MTNMIVRVKFTVALKQCYLKIITFPSLTNKVTITSLYSFNTSADVFLSCVKWYRATVSTTNFLPAGDSC